MRLARATRAGAWGVAIEPDAVSGETRPAIGVGRTSVIGRPPTRKAAGRVAEAVIPPAVVAQHHRRIAPFDDRPDQPGRLMHDIATDVGGHVGVARAFRGRAVDLGERRQDAASQVSLSHGRPIVLAAPPRRVASPCAPGSR
jgi:hypothetical protein